MLSIDTLPLDPATDFKISELTNAGVMSMRGWIERSEGIKSTVPIPVALRIFTANTNTHYEELVTLSWLRQTLGPNLSN